MRHFYATKPHTLVASSSTRSLAFFMFDTAMRSFWVSRYLTTVSGGGVQLKAWSRWLGSGGGARLEGGAEGVQCGGRVGRWLVLALREPAGGTERPTQT
jgi:hypothetical protein